MDKINNNFIKSIIEKELKDGRIGYDDKLIRFDNIITRFPPEPNGCLHIGHAKGIIINFLLANEFNGKTNLRFDDTNPEKEDIRFINSIKEDITWLGFNWDKELYTSSYFETLYNLAISFIKNGLAYVDFLTASEINQMRGNLKEPGKNSPYRDASIEDNLNYFLKMQNNEYNEGECILRAKIDMSSPNINLRDPVMYRIIKKDHEKTKDKWVIYPTYDWAHGQSDAIENITHSLCSLEFEDHRPLYTWYLKSIYKIQDKEYIKGHPRQIEFSRLNLTYTIMSKRKLLELIKNKVVDDWDDPRMPTISGMKRRGYTSQGIKNFILAQGITKQESIIDIEALEYFIREDLNKIALRKMVVFDPIKLTILNYDQEENLKVKSDGIETDELVPFSKHLYVEREDYKDNPNNKWFRLALNKEVRLQNAYYFTVTNVLKEGNKIIELQGTIDKDTKGGWSTRKVKGTIHWVSIKHSKEIKLNLFNRLFLDVEPDLKKDLSEIINKDSKKQITAYIDEINYDLLKNEKDFKNYQFIRKGYFIKDKISSENELIFNQTVQLKDNFKKRNN